MHMFSPKLQKALNTHMSAEFQSERLYLAMSAYLALENLSGFAHWMRVQADEERLHAMKVYTFIMDRGGKIVLDALDKPASAYKSARDVFAATLKHEQNVTNRINKLYELAMKEKDYPTQVLLQWFITEQVEEEKNVTEIIEQLKMLGNQKPMLLILDQKLSTRAAAVTDPAL